LKSGLKNLEKAGFSGKNLPLRQKNKPLKKAANRASYRKAGQGI
jgi:hypothetical protein